MTFQFEHGDYIVDLFDDPNRCEKFEASLSKSGITLPFPQRCAWLSRQRGGKFLFFAVFTRNGTAANGLALASSPSRALPGHVTLLAERIRPTDNGSLEAELHALAEYGRHRRRILRIHLEMLSRNPELRDRIARGADGLGFRRREKPRMYARTIVVDLSPEISEIFSSLHSTARRHIRSVEKNNLVLLPVADAVYAQRMSDLLRETMARTGGHQEQHDWPAIIKLSMDRPDLSRIAGLFREPVRDPNSLLAFAWGRNNGDDVDYNIAASTRETDIKAPLGYAVAWDLICWAKNSGASWFDFGGISAGSHASDDPLGGISDFKRYFSKQLETVAEEWVLEPHPVRARIASAVSSTAARLQRSLRPKGNGH